METMRPLSMRSRRVFPALFALLALLIPASASLAQEGFHLQPNDTVVFYGDSITNQLLYTTFTETFVVTRYPQMPVRFVHSGWGGDRVSGGGGGKIDVRLRRDVLAYKPTVMTIMLGMNDGRVRPFDEAIFNEFASGYQHIIKTMKEAVPKLRITVIQPSPFDDVTRKSSFRGGYNKVLIRYGEFVKGMAKPNNMLVADMNTPVVEALEKAKKTNRDLAQRIIPDRVHPGPGGHLLMAEALLKAWGATSLVTAVEIDAATNKVARADNTSVESLTAGKTISWTQNDRSLPMPVNMKDPVVALTVRSSDFMESMNQETLKVTGLQPGKYALKINGEAIGTFDATLLGRGINLAGFDTPMAKQAAAVHELTIKRTGVHQARWRQFQVPLQDDKLPQVEPILEILDELDAELQARQRAAAQPRACNYELTQE